MLVVISDLHLVDKTAGDHNVSGEAFKMWSEEIVALAVEQKVKRLDFLYLGDIIDLIRTTHWLGVEKEDRPWGDPAINKNPAKITEKCKEHTIDILENIERETHKQLGILSGSGWDKEQDDLLRGAGIEVRRAYIPGNHDRLYCVIPEVKAWIDEHLGITGMLPGQSLHRLESTEYGVLARHGHEFDVWNFEGYKHNNYHFDDEDYQRVPIGDPITTEVAAKIPLVVLQNLRGHVDEEVAQGVYLRLQDIENVRPLYAAFQWAYYQAEKLTGEVNNKKIGEIIRDSIAQVFEEFMALPFVEAWLDKHDSLLNPNDEADKLQNVLKALRLKIPLSVVEAVARFFVKEDVEYRAGAICEPLLQDPKSGMHYAIYGHTHQFDQLALDVLNGHEKIYFNSGTWRPRLHLTANKREFVEWKEMTYLIFYGHDEDRIKDKEGQPTAIHKGSSFENWTGTMLKRRR